ncbi:MAG: hypothetical protein U0587_02650 [Candidatus Binatia bacterium]
MRRKVARPADTPADIYDYWHRRWCEILTQHHRQAIVDAGLAGMSFTERVPDAPDGKGYFSYVFAADGSVQFMEGEGDAVAAYESYELGFRMLSDDTLDVAQPIASGRFRMISKPERWRILMSLIPILRDACRRAIEDAEREFDVELPKYW